MKKFCLLILFTLCSMLPILATEYEYKGVTIYYTGSGSEATITYKSSSTYNSYSGVVEIPETIDTGSKVYTVTAIGNSAFRNCEDLTEVIIPSTVTSIGNRAFQNCSSLESINLPDGVTSIGTYAFYDCESLEEMIIPDGVTLMDTYTFQNCTGLKTITLSKSLEIIDNYAFQNCSSLEEVTIPDKVTTIGTYAFYLCSNLEKLTLGASVETIGGSAFYQCTSLQTLEIPDCVKSIGASAFNSCSNLTEVKIGDGVTSIGNSTFYRCSSLEKLDIGASVETIGISAFYQCTSLQTLEIPDCVKSIGSQAFQGCSSLTYVKIGDGCTSIASGVFWNCTSLEKVYIGSSVETIGGSAFYDCVLLSDLEIGNSLVSMGNSAFYGCSSLTKVTLPASVTSIGDNTFSGCNNLISFTSLNPEPPTFTNDTPFNSPIYSKCILYVPLGSKQDYATADIWEKFTKIVEINEDGTIYYSVITNDATDVTYNSAILSAQVEGYEDGIIQKGFIYWTDDPDKVQIYVVEDDDFTYTLDDLTPQTTYTYCAFITTESSTFYGEHVEFTTLIQAPTIETLEATNVTEDSATLNATVEAGSEEILQKGYVYWMDNPNDVTVIVIEGDDMAISIEDLIPKTTYTYCAFVTTESGTLYGEHVEFTTQEEEAKAETHEAEDVTEHTAILTAEIEGDENEVIQKGFVYWTDDPNKAKIVIVEGDEFTYTLENLTAGTLYTYCAFIITENGPTYGEHVEFTTLVEAPTIKTLEATDVTDNAATLNAKLEIGSEEILEKGFIYWMDDPNDVTTLVIEGDEFTYTLDGLTAETTYTYCAFVITKSDTFYGETIEFTTDVASSINRILSEIGDDVQIYTLSGTRVNTLEKGCIYIFKYADGTTKKVMVK